MVKLEQELVDNVAQIAKVKTMYFFVVKVADSRGNKRVREAIGSFRRVIGRRLSSNCISTLKQACTGLQLQESGTQDYAELQLGQQLEEEKRLNHTLTEVVFLATLF